MQVRGAFSEHLINWFCRRNGINAKISATGCPSLSAVRWSETAKHRAVSIASALNPLSTKILNGAVILDSRLCQGRNLYVCQSHDDYSAAIVGARPDILVDENDVHMFTSIKEWATFYANTDALVTGSRVHGSILAIAQGNPAICTAGDLRASEMLNLIGMQAWRQRTLPNGPTLRDAFERVFYRQERLHEKFMQDFAEIEEFGVLA